MNAAFWKGRTVFITGHTGFKGSWLSLLLSHLGARVTGYALSPPTVPNLYELAAVGETVTDRRGDVRDAGTLRTALQEARPEVVIHMAAQALVRPSYEDPIGTYAVNVMGTVNLLEAARHTDGIRAIVVVTSDKCYENRMFGRGYREDDAMGGYDPYSSSKGCAELVAAAYRNSFFAAGRPALATARAGNVIGGGDWALDRLVPDIVRAFSAGRPVVVRNPLATRPWQHVLEPLSGYLALAERLCDRGSAAAQAWNFGPRESDAKPVSFIVGAAIRHWGKGAGCEQDRSVQPHEAHALRLDIGKSESGLGWVPALTLDEALDWTFRWYCGFRDGTAARALTETDIRAYLALRARGRSPT